MIVKLFMMTLVIPGVINMSRLETVNDITRNVVKKYNIQCVQILLSVNHPDFVHLGRLKKLVNELEIYVSIKRIHEMSRSRVLENCVSLFLVISGDDFMRTSLTQVNIIHNSKWLIFLEESIILEEYFSDIYVPLSCEFLVAQGDLQVKLTEVYRVHDKGPLQEFHMGTWSTDNTMVWSEETFLQRRKNLQGVIIRGIFIPEPPFIAVEQHEDGLPVKISGFCVQVWKELQKRLNFTIEFRIPQKREYGSREEDGSWSGMMGEILKDKADVSINLFIITKRRLSVIDYFTPLFNTKMIVHIRRPEMASSRFDQVFMQFTPLLWYVAIFTIVVLTLLVSACQYVTVKYNRQPEHLEYSLRDYWIYSIGIVCHQAHFKTPETSACRLLFLTTHFTVMVMFVAFSANFISFLANLRPILPFTDFKGILQDTTFKLGVIPNSEREAYFEKSNDKILKQIYQKQISHSKRPRNDQDGLKEMCADLNYGYFCTQVSVKGQTRSLPCAVTEIPQAYFAATVAMAVKKSSPYKKVISHQLQEMRRAGVIKRITDKFFLGHTGQLNTEHPSVTLGTIAVFCYILMGGTVISIIVLFFEILTHAIKTRR